MNGQASIRPQALAFTALFVVSGVAGLVYEVVWTRYLVDVFGVTAFAVSTVLVAFMGGMAIGAALFGRLATRSRSPLRLFAILEAGIGAYALAFPVILRVADAVHMRLLAGRPGSFAFESVERFVLCLALLAFPTVLMGGTLPALGQGLIRDPQRIGRGAGILYFANTLGASLGCYLAGFHLVPALGLRGATLVAAGLNAAVAVCAWSMGREGPSTSTAPAALAPSPFDAGSSAAAAHWVPAIAFASGFLALAFEVVWFRVLVLVFGSTVYSFSAMLSAFLLGLAIGSALSGAVVDRLRRPVRALAVAQAGVATAALVGYASVNAMPDLFLRTIFRLGLDFDGMNRTKLLLSLVTVLPAAIAFGAVFPAAVRIVSGGVREPARGIARVYAANTTGAILGSFLTGFVFLPMVGAERTMHALVLGALAVAFAAVVAEPGPMSRGWAAVAGISTIVIAVAWIVAPDWDRRLLGSGVYFEPKQYVDPANPGVIDVDRVISDYHVMTFDEGYNETIISFRSSQGKFITVNGSATASDHFDDMFPQRLHGHLPAALHPAGARTAAVVGLGAGVTAGSLAVHGIERVVGLELEKGVFQASRYFGRENHDLLDRPNLEVVLDDGRIWLKKSDERFDIISAYPNFPSLSGSGTLYSRDFFEICRSRLAPGGVMSQFVPIWRLDPSVVRTILRTFAEVFPHVRVFRAGLSLVLLGREQPFPDVDAAELARRLSRPEVQASLVDVGVRGPIELLSFYLFDEAELRQVAGEAPESTRDRPRVEFDAPKSLFSDTVARNLLMVASARPPVEERARRLGLGPGDAEAFRTLAMAADRTIDAEIAFDSGNVQEGLRLAIPVAESGYRHARYLVAGRAESLGLELQRLGRLEEARAQFALALRYEPGRLTSLIGLGYVDLFQGRVPEALEVLGAAVARFPENALAHLRLGVALEVAGRMDDAEREDRRAIELRPGLQSAHGLLGQRLLDRGNPEGALEEFESAWRNGERNLGVSLGRARAYLAVGDTRKAHRIAVEASRQWPHEPGIQVVIADCAAALGRMDERDRALQRARELETLRNPAPRPSTPEGPAQ